MPATKPTGTRKTRPGRDRPAEPAPEARPVRTLAVDVGATGIKATVLNELGEPVGERVRERTPRPGTPEQLVGVFRRLAERLQPYDRVSIGFPGVVHEGVVRVAPKLSPAWENVNAAALFEAALSAPARVANDADVQGFGAISGKGVELVVTLGTGVGSALFVDGRLVPNLEVGRDKLSDASRRAAGDGRWQRRMAKFVRKLERMFHFDHLYLGGGNAARVDVGQLPGNVRVVSNLNGLLGGIALWRGHDAARFRPAHRGPGATKADAAPPSPPATDRRGTRGTRRPATKRRTG
jgi:polyphosphate glucokinase